MIIVVRMQTLEQLLAGLSEFERNLGYDFTNKRLLLQAFVHRSYLNENRDFSEPHNERLEFLGDSVLGLIVAEFLYQNFPEEPEGELSRLRSLLVEAGICAQYALKLGIEQFLLLSRGERRNDGRGRASILANALEALLGAIYLDGGFENARRVFLSIFQPDLEAILHQPLVNWKAMLQDWTQKRYQKTPTYRILEESGPEHQKIFRVAVFMEEELLGEGEGASKKQAEQAAAEAAVKKVGAHG